MLPDSHPNQGDQSILLTTIRRAGAYDRLRPTWISGFLRVQIGGAASVRQRHALPLSDGQGEPDLTPIFSATGR